MNILTQQIVTEARKWIGTKEVGHNDGPEVRAWLKRVNRRPGAPWCAAFAWCMLDDACRELGVRNPIEPVAGVHLFRQLGKERDTWTREPGAGYVFLIDHGIKDGVKLGHCGIVVDVGPKSLVTIEGNGLPLSSPVLTPTGWNRIGDLKPGDEVIDPMGGKSHVAAVYPQGKRPVFRINFEDGSSVVADAKHRWCVHARERVKQKTVVFTTEELLARLRKPASRTFLPRIVPPELGPRKAHALDPYLVGLLIGDGGMTQKSAVRFSTNDSELLESAKRLIPRGCKLKHIANGDWRIVGPEIHASVRRLGMNVGAASKRIPDEYKWAPSSDRLAILQGLMDTDGSVDTSGRMEFCTISKDLAEDVQFLVQSLGGKCRICKKSGIMYTSPTQRTRKPASDAYILRNIRFPDSTNPFRLVRKANRLGLRSGLLMRGWGLKSIEPCGEAETVCISVTASSGMYLTENFIPTHNTNEAGSREGNAVALKTRRLVDITLGYLDPGKLVVDEEFRA